MRYDLHKSASIFNNILPNPYLKISAKIVLLRF